MVRERRKFKRFDAYMTVKLRGEKERAGDGSGLSKDLSREGMKVNTNQPLRNGSVVDLEIDLPDDPKPIHIDDELLQYGKTLIESVVEKTKTEDEQDYPCSCGGYCERDFVNW